MNHQAEPSTPDADAIQERVKAGVKAHRIKLRLLTMAAFVLGFVAMITSLLVVWCYPVFILPKARELELEAAKLIEQLKANATAPAPGDDAGRQTGKLLAVEIQMTNITTAGTVVVAVAVGLLGLGTLTLLTVVILNRRVALNQINASLAELSNALREWPKTRGGP